MDPGQGFRTSQANRAKVSGLVAKAGVTTLSVFRWLRLSKPMGSHFGVGGFTTHFRTYFSGDCDVHWGYGLLTHGQVTLSITFWLPCSSLVEGEGVPKQGYSGIMACV